MFGDFDSMTFDEVTTSPAISTVGTDIIRVKILQRDHLWKRFSMVLGEMSEFENMSELQLKVKADILERQFNTFEKIQFALEELDESQFDGTHRADFEAAYITVKSAIATKLKSLNIEQLNGNRMPATSSSTQPEVKPAKLQLFKFDGRHSEWLRYYNMFLALVHNNNDLNDGEKFEYLRSSLTDSAAQLIKSLEETPVNYTKAIELLVSHYDNKRLVFQSHLNTIFAAPKINNPSVSALRELVDTVNTSFGALQALGTANQIVDGFILQLITSKLDESTQQRWEQEVASKWDRNVNATLQLPSWHDLEEFLDSRSGRKSVPKSQPQKQIMTATNLFEKCLLCDGRPYHNAFNCLKFIKLDAYERHDLAKRLKLCLNCLRQHHSSNSCPSHRRCQQCRVSHHTLLHRTYDGNGVANIKPNKGGGEVIEKPNAVHQPNQMQYHAMA